jgi:hypothetical protein
VKNVKQVDKYISFLYYNSYIFSIGNTEEEIEEHTELTKVEHRSAFSKAPKQKYEPNIDKKKKSSKTKHSSSNTKSTIKTDL